MGIFFSSKSKKSQKKPNNVFERRKEEVQKRIEEAKKNADPKNKRAGKLGPWPVGIGSISPGPIPGPSASLISPSYARPYNDVAMDQMRHQLNYDADAFLLNNILLSVQFLENYEREMLQINDKPISEGENLIDDAMIRYNKHVFFADRVIECVSRHVNYQRSRSQLEPLASPKLYVIYDNVEAKEPGNTSDYSSALDVPYYKLRIEDSKEPGYLKLKKLEVLESKLRKETPIDNIKETSDESLYADSENDLNDADDTFFTTEDFSLNSTSKIENKSETNYITDNASSSNLDNNINTMQVLKENESKNVSDNIDHEKAKPKPSILKKTKRTSPAARYIRAKERRSYYHNNSIAGGSEYGSSGYGSILSGSSTSESAHYASSAGFLSDECWNAVVKKVDNESDDEDEKISHSTAKRTKSDDNLSDEDDDDIIESAYKALRNLHKRCHYLNSLMFMTNFIVNFKKDLGTGLGFDQESIKNAMTYGASIYCNTFKDYLKTEYEIIPALKATWPNVANLWIIRERKIIQNPRNNYKYQWPVNDMVSKVRDLECLLIPLGYRPKEGSKSNQKLQWKFTFPAAERYLESTLAHSHMRCYLFSLVLHKTFMDNEMMIGIDASHIKNHLFWQCEDNFAKWPEDRLGESFKLFMEVFYAHVGKAKLPNYFTERCNEFESIPTSVLLLLQRKLKDILEAPVMHMLYAIDKLKYNNIGFYPTFNCQKLNDILTSKNPLHLSNSDMAGTNYNAERSGRQRKTIKTDITLPKRLETERRHLVFKFFIPHFIAMARSSEKFDAINQAMIYLEQAKRLCFLLMEEPGGDTAADEYMEIIRDKLVDCQRKKVNQDGFNLPPRDENPDRYVNSPVRQRPKLKLDRVVNPDSLKEDHAIPAVTIADIYAEEQQRNTRITDDYEVPSIITADVHKRRKEPTTEEHGITSITVVDIHVEKQKPGHSVTQNHGKSTSSYADIQVEQRIQLDDSDIEESYL